MGLVKITFDGSNVSAKQDADINYHLNGLIAAGILKGLGGELAASTSNNNIIFQSGYVQIYGRRIYVESNSSVYISLDSSKYGYIIITVNLSDNSVQLTKAENASTYPTLTQQNLATGGTIYQMPIARYRKTASSLTLDTGFEPTKIDTPLAVANDGYSRALSYISNYRSVYTKKGYSYSSTISLWSEQHEMKNQTYFIAKMSTGHIIGFPGNAISSLSSYTCSYCDGGTNYSVVISYSESGQYISFTCSNTSHYVSQLIGIR